MFDLLWLLQLNTTPETAKISMMKTQQMSERTDRTRATKEIQLDSATKVLRAEHSDFWKYLSLRFPAQTWVEYRFATHTCLRGRQVFGKSWSQLWDITAALGGGAIEAWPYSRTRPSRVRLSLVQPKVLVENGINLFILAAIESGEKLALSYLLNNNLDEE